MDNHLKAVLKWSEIIYDRSSDFAREIEANPENLIKPLVIENAVSVYKEMKRRSGQLSSHWLFEKEFIDLNDKERESWYSIAARIPYKLSMLGLMIRTFKGFCRTCIITEEEIDALARDDHDQLSRKLASAGWRYAKEFDREQKKSPILLPFDMLRTDFKRFYTELNYLLPVLLKNRGLEIIRAEEIKGIDERLLNKLARAVHSRYTSGIRSHGLADEVLRTPAEWDELPEDIRLSNLDNAWHIPTKLLAIGYRIRPAERGYRSLPLALNNENIEIMSRVEHLRWCWDKRLNGWVYGVKHDAEARRHPSLIPYDQLSETEKDKDRELVSLIPALLQDINYEVYPVNPGITRRLSYAIKPDSSIQRLLNKTSEMSREIGRIGSLSPEIGDRIKSINKSLGDTINEVRGSYNYARHIQETFLPDDLFIRECFPESFVLYNPKDIVSGDFYLFSRLSNKIVFAAADCTGHGIPGALLSTIGYGILDQAVNELKLTEPHLILEHLYSKIHRFLRRNNELSGMSDDMDIILCTLDSDTNILSYSGLGNPLHLVSGGEIITYKTRNLFKGINEQGYYIFESGHIQLRNSDRIYIGSDGFADQFGGSDHKKYMTGRLKSLLLDISDLPMHEQCERLYEELEKWREEGSEEQTDDILLIGIKIL